MNMTPWDDNFDINNDTIPEDFWENIKAEDFYFCVYLPGSDYEGSTDTSTVAISPKAYVDKEGYLWDGGMNLSSIFGEKYSYDYHDNSETFIEAMTSVYEFIGTAPRARQILLELGMSENLDMLEDDVEIYTE